MCLVKKSIFPKFTLRDKIVYKVVYSNYSPGGYRSPFRNYLIELDKEYEGERLNSNPITSFLTFKIYDGYIHSVKSLKDALRYIDTMKFSRNTYILKAVIPKYTLYWEGKNNDIASRKIKYIDEICKINGNRTKIYPCRMA